MYIVLRFFRIFLIVKTTFSGFSGFESQFLNEDEDFTSNLDAYFNVKNSRENNGSGLRTIAVEVFEEITSLG